MGKSVRFVVGIVTVAVLAAGCGGDSDDESSSTTTPAASETTTSPDTTGPPTSDPRSADQLAADRAEAEKAVLKLADLPPGWTGEPDTDDASPEAQAAREQFAECAGLDRSLIGNPTPDRASAKSDDFESGRLEVQSRVTVLPSAERSRAQLSAFRKPESRSCFETFVNAAIQQVGGNVGSQGQVAVLDLGGLRADASGYRARLQLTARGQTAEAVTDILLAIKGRTVITMSFSNIGEPFPAALETSLTNTVIDRAPAS